VIITGGTRKIGVWWPEMRWLGLTEDRAVLFIRSDGQFWRTGCNYSEICVFTG
jgi:hypothetical protein